MPSGVYIRTKEHNRKNREAQKEAQNRVGIKKRKSESAKKVWEDLEKREELSKVMKKVLSKPRARKRKSKAQIKAWKDPIKRKNMVDAQKEVHNRSDVKENHSKAAKEVQNRPEVKEIRKKIMKEISNRTEVKEKRREYMLNGGADYVNSFNTNPSKDELKIREMVLEQFPDFIPNYKPLENRGYRLDLGHPIYKIAIEVDGWQHFRNQEKIDYDKRRQEEIEVEGWTFIRYNIFQSFPTKEQIRKDIEKVLSF